MVNCVVDDSVSYWIEKFWKKSKFEVDRRDFEFSFGCIEFEVFVRLKEKLFICFWVCGFGVWKMDLNYGFFSLRL